MFLLKRNFFSIPDPIQGVALGILPLTHVVSLLRGLIVGQFPTLASLRSETIIFLNMTRITIAVIVFFLLSIHLMKKRLIQ